MDFLKVNTQTHGIEIFKKILDALPNSVYLKDINGRYLWINKASLKELSLKHLISTSIIGKTDSEIFPITDALKYAENDKSVIETNQGICVEEDVLLPSGQKRTQLSFKEPLYGDNCDLIGVSGYTIDITEIKKKEAALIKEKENVEAANKAKKEFLANMRHDFRTPFSGLLGLTQLLATAEEDPKKKENLNIIAECADMLLKDLNEFFEYLELQNGIPILLKQFNINELLDEILTIYKPVAEQQQTQLRLVKHNDLPTYLIGDKFRTKRILENLVSNAIKFTHKGKATIEAGIATQQENRVIAKFNVRDTGIGMHEDTYNIIFEPLTRLNPSYNGVYRGKGFGLKLVKTFLDEINGEVHVKSQLGAGSEFNILIPYKKCLLDCPAERL